MGEIQRHHVTHHLSPELRELLEAIKPGPPGQPMPDPGPDHGPEVEYWAFYDPRQDTPVTAYLDPQNQVRHVPVGRATEVPKTWRRIYLEVKE